MPTPSQTLNSGATCPQQWPTSTHRCKHWAETPSGTKHITTIRTPPLAGTNLAGTPPPLALAGTPPPLALAGTPPPAMTAGTQQPMPGVMTAMTTPVTPIGATTTTATRLFRPTAAPADNLTY